MAIIGWLMCFGMMLYFLAVCVFGMFAVSFSIAMGGGKPFEYCFPIAGLIVVVWLFYKLFQHSPFVVSLL